MPVLLGGHNLPPAPLVEIGLTDLPKSGGAMAMDVHIYLDVRLFLLKNTSTVQSRFSDTFGLSEKCH